MKYLYELTLNHRELIISKVVSICEMDTYISSGCTSRELNNSIVHLLSDIILGTLENQSLYSGKALFDVDFNKAASNINQDIIHFFLLNGIGIKLLIAFLKHFRNSIKSIIFQEIDDKDTLLEYLETNNKYFDSLEFSLYDQWESKENDYILIKKLFDFTSHGVFIQVEHHITYVNAIGECIFGYNSEELKSMSFFDIIHPEYIHIFQQNKVLSDSLEKCMKNKCKIKNKNGTEVWIDISIDEIDINGRSYLIGTVIDITDHKKMEELKLLASDSIKQLNDAIEMDKIKTEFFSNLSHELRTPLNVILGTLQLVDMYSTETLDPIMEKTKKYFKIMRQNCYRLLRLVNNLVDLNKLDAGYMNMNIENHDVVDIVSKIAASVSDYVENKGINFEYCSKTEAKIIACDPDKLERILLNLLSNAIKFTDCGGKILFNVWDKDGKIFISVKDSGIGIPKEKQDMVFRRFVQIDKSLSRNHNGSGIGLSLSKSLVELHGGKISLISETGKGCEFIIELPIIELAVMERTCKESQYNSNNKIEVIKIEFSDIYT